VDGAELSDGSADVQPSAQEPEPSKPPAAVSIRALLAAIGILVLVGFTSFASVFLYQYWKPKFGSLIVKTTPPGAAIFVDGKQRGVSPLTIGDLLAGGHQLKAAREGYKELVQPLEVMPYATENVHLNLEPLVSHLTNEQLAEVESLRKKLEGAEKENIMFPPPEDYNALYFANKILAIDPANAYALEVKSKMAEAIRQSADLAYAREDWLEAEKQYKNLSLIYPDDISINERLTDISAKIDASVKDREQQITEWKSKSEAALNSGTLLPPARDNALDAIRTVQRLDRKNDWARRALVQLKETLQNRGDTKITSGDWQGARNDFRLVLQYFPDDPYSKSRIALADGKLADQSQAEQQHAQRVQEEQQSRQKTVILRQSALAAYRSAAYSKAIAEWQEYLKAEPNSDEAYYYIGASNMELKQLDTAILNFEKSISLNPGNALAHLNLGILYDRHRNDAVHAIEHFQKVRDLGGVEKYTSERLQAMIFDVQERQQVDAMHRIPFPVEHKHTFSSCKGNMRITEEGIEFNTTETDHSFYEPFKALKSFSINGDEVSIRTINNRKYNFRLLNPDDAARVRRLASRHAPMAE
jgi:tetratricopeptide (TPR) repeat protein